MLAGYIHWTVCEVMGLQDTTSYCEHVREMVINVSGTAIMWQVPVTAGRTVLANRRDKILHYK
jgi:hypothetical protein